MRFGELSVRQARHSLWREVAPARERASQTTITRKRQAKRTRTARIDVPRRFNSAPTCKVYALSTRFQSGISRYCETVSSRCQALREMSYHFRSVGHGEKRKMFVSMGW